MAGLDLRLKRQGDFSAPPRCSELSDAMLNFTYDDGSAETLYVDGEMYECSKLNDTVYLANGRGAAFAIDMAHGAVTCVAMGGGSPIVTTGVFGENTGKHAVTSDFDGNTINWFFGDVSVTALYSDGGVTLTGNTKLSVEELTTVSLGVGVYLQSAVVLGEGRPQTMVLLCDFTRNYCIGAVLGMEPKRFEGYATFA